MLSRAFWSKLPESWLLQTCCYDEDVVSKLENREAAKHLGFAAICTKCAGTVEQLTPQFVHFGCCLPESVVGLCEQAPPFLANNRDTAEWVDMHDSLSFFFRQG